MVDKVIEMLQEATLHSWSTTGDRIHAANVWRKTSHTHAHPSELEAIRETLNLLDLAVAETASLEGVSTRLSEDETFRSAQGVASDAAALAIQAGDLPMAVSLLEQGRSIIFSQLGRYRSSVEQVRSVAPELATRLGELGVQLDALVFRGEHSNPTSNVVPDGLQEEASRYVVEIASSGSHSHGVQLSRHYSARAAWISTVDEIRRLPGLESFLLPPRFTQIQQAAAKGPVVIVNIHQKRSDAIIVLATNDPILVPLPDASPDMLRTYIERLGERPANTAPRFITSVLREVWAAIVEPVVNSLRATPTGLPEGSRLWWCPTGLASKLPLHAAGPCERNLKNLSELVASSYTPTLGALVRANQARVTGQSVEEPSTRILVVGQPETPGENPLPAVVEEVRAIKECAPYASVLMSSEGTRPAVLNGIQERTQWLHLACHGHYDAKQPFHSSFSMHDGRITLLELIEKDLPHAELAFLSACHSARVSDILPDEALHPAAGMMFAGFRSVIGTMWALDDSVGSAVAGKFYQLMLDGKKTHSDAAVVLADAIRKLGNKTVPFVQRINIVHYGA